MLISGMIIISFSSYWALKTWNGLTMEEIVYHLKAPLEGTGDGLIGKYVMQCIIPTLLSVIVIMVIGRITYKHKKRFVSFCIFYLSIVVLFFMISVYQFWMKLDVSAYIRAQKENATFIEENYVDPWRIDIQFPEEKRNLIFIYLESMETTYANIENGGGFSFNCIPELTNLAQENEDFSGESSILNGAYVMPGTSWTMGALFGHTAGLPLQISIHGNDMDTQNTFFPSIASMGDILELEGYRQVLMIGSDAVFGGRKLYFTNHGSYEMFDYSYAVEKEFISKNYKVFWGYEDKKLFSFAKEQLVSLTETEQPFNLTLLTVDTHFEDGYICEDCKNEFAENQYANVMACSSKQVYEFVEWIQKQDFYENTTIVVMGDHLTMDSNFCSEVDDSYDRKTYVSYINAVSELEKPELERIYTTFDTFPTTLAAIGAKIKGNRLGLGTNLFSSKETLAEKYGLDYIVQELEKKSTFMEQLASLDETTDNYLKRVGKYPTASVDVIYDKENSIANILVSNIINLEDTDKVELEIRSLNEEETKILSFDEIQNGNCYIELDWSDYEDHYVSTKIYLVDSTGRRYFIEELLENIALHSKPPCPHT